MAETKAVAWSVVAPLLAGSTGSTCSLGTMHTGVFEGEASLLLVLREAVDAGALQALSHIRHSNLASMIAYAVDKTQTCVVFAWQCTTLRERLEAKSIGWDSRLKVTVSHTYLGHQLFPALTPYAYLIQVAVGVARVLLYLEENMHGVLDSRCIGLDLDDNPVLFGIGLADIMTGVAEDGRVSPGYRCPVYAQGCAKFDVHAQVSDTHITRYDM